MATTDDAHAWARRIVEETLLEAGLVTLLDASHDVPPVPPTFARQAARRIVEASQREHEDAQRRAERAATATDGPPERPAEVSDVLAPDEPAPDVRAPDPDEPAPDQDERLLPGGPAVGGPPPPLAVVDGWWQGIRERYRRRQAMAVWTPDATRAPRRTGRWLLVTLLALGAIALLYPMAVDALRQLVAL